VKYGYARISTIDHNADMQLKALKRAGCEKIFKDERTGAAHRATARIVRKRRRVRVDSLA
jgi:DNA invertase Pin-like site-specific DNA recombinase